MKSSAGDPDNLYWERVRDDNFQRAQRKIEQEIDRRKLDLEQDRIVQDTAEANPVSPRETILQCRRDILNQIKFYVWLDASLKEDWTSQTGELDRCRLAERACGIASGRGS